MLTTRQYLHGLVVGKEHDVPIEPGKTLLMSLVSIGAPDEHGMRQVVCLMNGQMRMVSVRDNAVKSTVAVAERADPAKPGQVGAPFAGVVTVVVAEGDTVEAGQTVATIEAMKMEAAITTPVGGVVDRVAPILWRYTKRRPAPLWGHNKARRTVRSRFRHRAYGRRRLATWRRRW